MCGNRFSASTSCSRWLHETEPGPPNPSLSCCFLKVATHPINVFGRLPERDVPCPKCVEGRLVHRENARDRGAFYGCSNWPYCEHTQSPCPDCGKGLPVKKDGQFHCRNCGQSIEACPNGDGWLRTRIGKYGRFLSCSNWPACDYTRDFRQERKRRRTQAGSDRWSGQRSGRQ